MIVSWRYTQLNGKVALDHAPAATPERHRHFRQPFAVRWNGSWQVIASTASAMGPPTATTRLGPTATPSSEAAATSVDIRAAAVGRSRSVATSLLGEQLTRATAPELATYAWESISAPNTAEGCLLIGGLSNGTGPVGPTANVLYRFGLLYAANDAAHRLLPGLPLVDTHGQTIASQIAAQPR